MRGGSNPEKLTMVVTMNHSIKALRGFHTIDMTRMRVEEAASAVLSFVHHRWSGSIRKPVRVHVQPSQATSLPDSVAAAWRTVLAPTSTPKPCVAHFRRNRNAVRNPSLAVSFLCDGRVPEVR